VGGARGGSPPSAWGARPGPIRAPPRPSGRGEPEQPSVLERLAVGDDLLRPAPRREGRHHVLARPSEAAVAAGPGQPHGPVAGPVDERRGEGPGVARPLPLGVVPPVDEAGVGEVREAHRGHVVPEVPGDGRAQLVRAHGDHVARCGVGVDGGGDLTPLGPVRDHVVAAAHDAQHGHDGQHHAPCGTGADRGHPQPRQEGEQREDHGEVATGEGGARQPAGDRPEHHRGGQDGGLGPRLAAGAEVELDVTAVE
jgi:hypothetical protein